MSEYIDVQYYSVGTVEMAECPGCGGIGGYQELAGTATYRDRSIATGCIEKTDVELRGGHEFVCPHCGYTDFDKPS